MQAEPVQHQVDIVQSHAEPVMQAEWTIPAPPACRAEFSLAPESIRAFTGQLPAVGGFVVLMALAIVIVRAGRRMIPERPDTMRIVHGSPSPAPFGSREMANLAAAEANSHYWQCMLAAFGGALEAEGFTLRAEPRSKVQLPYAVRARVGVAIVKARSRYLSPRQSDDTAEAMLNSMTTPAAGPIAVCGEPRRPAGILSGVTTVLIRQNNDTRDAVMVWCGPGRRLTVAGL